jgi:hypothetical protein
MDQDFCSCEEWVNLKESYSDLFNKDLTYGWVIKWIELTKDKGCTKVHRYGLKIYYCPMCGKKLVDNE